MSATPAGEAQRGGERRDPEEQVALGSGPYLALPHGFGSRRKWEFTVGLLSATLDQERLSELVTGTWIAGYQDGEVTLAAPSAVQADRLTGEYRDLVARKLSEAMRRPVRLAVLTAAPAEDDMSATEPLSVEPSMEEVDAIAQPTSFMVAECGLPSGQVWAAVLDEVLQSSEISRANFDAWLRPTVLLGRGDDGAFIVGAPHALAKRRVATRFLPVLQQGITAVVGELIRVEIVVSRDWLHGQSRGKFHNRSVRERQLGA
jgi:chromosomal replication initiation ATPase DnaA